MIALIFVAAVAGQQFDLKCSGKGLGELRGKTFDKEYSVDLDKPAVAFINDNGVGPALNAIVTPAEIKVVESWGTYTWNRTTGGFEQTDAQGRPYVMGSCTVAPYQPMAATKF